VNETFGKYGKISSTLVREDNKGRKFAFVSFEEHDSAKKAVEELHGNDMRTDAQKAEDGDKDMEKDCDGHPAHQFYVQRAQNKKERAADLRGKYTPAGDGKAGSVNLYVKNLDESMDDDALRALFEPFGAVTSAKAVMDEGKDGEAKQCKGFGFVNFAQPEEATKAVTEMHLKVVKGKPLYVGLAEKKDARQERLRQRYVPGEMKGGMKGGKGGMKGGKDGGKGGGPMGMQGGPMGMPGGQGMMMGMGGMGMQGGPMMMGKGQMPGMMPGMGMMNPQMMMGKGQMPGMNPQMMMGKGQMPGMNPQMMMGKGQMPGMPMMNPQMMMGKAPMQGMPMGKGMPMGPMPGQMGMMPQGMPNQGAAAAPNPNAPLSAAALAAAPPATQKQMIGEKLFPAICKFNQELAGKITGMMLEMDNSELLLLLESDQQMKMKVDEALRVLQAKK